MLKRITERRGSRSFLAQMSHVNLFGDVMDYLLPLIPTLFDVLSLILESFCLKIQGVMGTSKGGIKLAIVLRLCG